MIIAIKNFFVIDFSPKITIISMTQNLVDDRWTLIQILNDKIAHNGNTHFCLH